MDASERDRLLRALAAAIGDDEAATLMEQLPPFEWSKLATKDDLAALATKDDLAALATKVDTLGATTATKDDLAALATKVDILGATTATKDDLATLGATTATKDELAGLATKEEIAVLATRDEMLSGLARLESRLVESHASLVERIETNNRTMLGFIVATVLATVAALSGALAWLSSLP